METLDNVRPHELRTIQEIEQAHVLVADCGCCKACREHSETSFSGTAAELRAHSKCLSCGKFMAEILLFNPKSLKWNPCATEAIRKQGTGSQGPYPDGLRVTFADEIGASGASDKEVAAATGRQIRFYGSSLHP